MLDGAVAGLNDERDLAPLRATLHATDTGRDFHLHGPEAGTEAHISGTETSILAWLMGRSDGAALTHDTPGPLPAVPSSYYT